MLWILRRTGAVNFFNSINSNHSSNNKISDRNNSRPPRKAYGRLSVDADDNNMYRKDLKYQTTSLNDDDDDDEDNLTHSTFQLQSKTTDTFQSLTSSQNNCNNHNHHHFHHNNHRNSDGTNVTSSGDDHNGQNNNNNNSKNNNNNEDDELNLETGETTIEHHKRIISDLHSGDPSNCLTAPHHHHHHHQHHHNNHHSSCHSNCSNLMNGNSCREIRESMLRNGNIDDKTITRLQAMAMQDEDEFDESLTCNVCDRAFHCHRQLASHQQKKRHFGCSGCDSLFPSLMLLEHHKEEFEHWSDVEDDDRRNYCCKRNRRILDDDDFYDTDTATSDAESEDLERLL